MPAGGARYLRADLMLLTHAGCAFKDPRGRFGISALPAPVRSHGTRQRESKSVCRHSSGRLRRLKRVICSGTDAFHSFAPLHCAVTAGTGQPLFTREERGRWLHLVSLPQLKELWFTCTARPDGSGARSGRLRPARCERTAALHAPGMHESGGCNGSRLPAVPDTSRHPQPWRSG